MSSTKPQKEATRMPYAQQRYKQQIYIFRPQGRWICFNLQFHEKVKVWVIKVTGCILTKWRMNSDSHFCNFPSMYYRIPVKLFNSIINIVSWITMELKSRSWIVNQMMKRLWSYTIESMESCRVMHKEPSLRNIFTYVRSWIIHLVSI